MTEGCVGGQTRRSFSFRLFDKPKAMECGGLRVGYLAAFPVKIVENQKYGAPDIRGPMVHPWVG